LHRAALYPKEVASRSLASWLRDLRASGEGLESQPAGGRPRVL